MNFSQQLITELAMHLNPTLTQFIDKNEYSFQNLNTRNIVTEAMEKYCVSNSKDVLNRRMREERKERKRKKRFWSNRIITDMENSAYSDPTNPFFSTYSAYNNLSSMEREKLGWGTVEDVIDNKLKTILEWRDNVDTYLIDYPLLSYLTHKKIYDALISDTFVDIFNYLKDAYDLNINSFQKLYTDTLIENPLFGEKKEKLDLEKDTEEDTLVEKLFLTKDSVFNTIVSVEDAGNAPMRSLGPKDLDMIQYGMFNNIGKSFYSNRTVIAKLRDFAQILCPSKYNKKYVKMAGDMLLSYQKFNYSVRDLKNDIAGDAFNLFDRIQIVNPADFVPSETDYYSPDADVIIHFGDRLYQDIIQTQVIGITQSSYDKVDSELAHLLAPVLQMQRTILSKELPSSDAFNIDAQMTKSYDYVFFASSVRTLTKRKKDNIQRLCNAFDEYVAAELFIKKYTFKNNVFTVTFYPLTDDELADIQINKKDMSLTKQLNMQDLL